MSTKPMAKASYVRHTGCFVFVFALNLRGLRWGGLKQNIEINYKQRSGILLHRKMVIHFLTRYFSIPFHFPSFWHIRPWISTAEQVPDASTKPCPEGHVPSLLVPYSQYQYLLHSNKSAGSLPKNLKPSLSRLLQSGSETKHVWF